MSTSVVLARARREEVWVAAHIRVFGATRALRLVLRLIKRDATAPPADKQRCATDAIDHEVEI